MKRTSVGAVFLTVLVDLIGFGIVLPLLPLYADRFHASGEEIGLLFASFSAMQFLFAPIWGRVSDRVGRRPVLLVGDQRARGMALIGAAFGIGFTIGPPLGFLAMHEGEALAAGGFVPAAFARGLPGFLAAAISLGSFLWTLTSVGEPARHTPTDRKLLDLSAFRRARSPGALEVLLVLHLLSVFAFSNFESTLSLMLDDRFHYAKNQMACVFLFVGVMLAFAQGFVVRRLMTRFREEAMTRAGFVLMFAGLAGLAICAPLPLLLASLAVAVGGFGCVTPSLSSLISKQGDAANQGAMMGLAASASALGRIFGPFAGNVVYAPEGQQGTALGPTLAPLFGELAHHQRPYVLGAALVALLAVAAVIWLPRAAGRTGEG